MKTIGKIMLGLLILTPGLYAMDKDAQFEKERETKMARAQQEEDDAEEVVDPIGAAIDQLRKQSPEQTARAQELKDAVLNGNGSRVLGLLMVKADVNARVSGGGPAICYAFDPEILQLLLDRRANVNSIDLDKTTALHQQCHMAALKKEDRTNCFLLLLNNKANVNAQNKFGNTPLHCLVPNYYYSEAKPDLVTLLLEYGANPTIKNLPGPSLSGQTCLDTVYEGLQSDDLRVPLCKMAIAFDAHRKRIDAIKDALATCHTHAFTRGVDRLVLEYTCGAHRADDKKLDALFTEFKWLFEQLRKSGELPSV